MTPEGKGAALARLIDALPPERREQVFTHTSWAPDRTASYERLEFLGDSVLELAIARALYDRHPEASEGQLAKIRAHAVSRQSCAAVARELGLDGRDGVPLALAVDAVDPGRVEEPAPVEEAGERPRLRPFAADVEVGLLRQPLVERLAPPEERHAEPATPAAR